MDAEDETDSLGKPGERGAALGHGLRLELEEQCTIWQRALRPIF